MTPADAANPAFTKSRRVHVPISILTKSDIHCIA
jgi:hypothetical protein